MIRRRLPALLAVLAAVLAAGFIIGGLARSRVETGIGSFLPAHDRTVEQLDELASSFGGDPIVILLESTQPRLLLDSDHLHRLLRLEGQLTGLGDVAAVYGPATTLNQIAGQMQDFLAELSGRRDAVRATAEVAARGAGATEQKAREAGDSAIAQFDQRYGPLVVQGLPAGLPTLGNERFVQSVVFAQGQAPRPQWRFVVPSQNAVAVLVRPRQGIDAGAAQRLVDRVRGTVRGAGLDGARVTVSGVPVLAAGVSDQVRSEAPRLGGIAVVLIGACFLFVPWTRRRRRLLPLASTLVAIGLTLAILGWAGRPLSLGVVAFLPVLLGIGSYYPTYFTRNARRRVVLTVAAATSASFATLLLSPLPFVRDLGLTLSIGVLVSAGLGALLPAVPAGSARADEPAAAESVPAHQPSRARRRGTGLAVAVAVVVAAAGWAALPGLRLDSDFESLAAGASTLKDAQHVESVVGSSGELSVVLRGVDVTSPAAVEWMRVTQQRLIADHGDQLRPVVSPPTLLQFLGPDSTAEQIGAALRLLPPYLAGSVIRGDHQVATMVFGVRMDDLDALRALRDDIGRVLVPPSGFQVEIAGLSMVAVRGQEMLSSERTLGNLLGISAAAAVLAVGLRRRGDALRALAAAALATGAGLFLLWVLGIPLSPITVGLGSLTAAVGCEFTVLLSEAARRGGRALRTPVLLAATTSAVGYLVLAASDLAVIRQFGVLLAGAVGLALAAAGVVVAVAHPRSSRVRPEPGPRPVAHELVGVK
ncbi:MULTISPECIES: RND transporter [Protofrankia]|uniref:RND transporter n=1 Tax=Protofrankia TaxID=2994361 RepID=UPI00064093B5|nr:MULTISPECIES: RND transporter [Protofrankia]